MLKGIVLKRVLPFVLAAFSGAFVFYLFAPIDVPAVKTASTGSGYGSSGGSGICPSKVPRNSAVYDSFEPRAETSGVKITHKRAASYTDAARENNIEGSVRLKVTLLASGEVGSVSVVRGLPDGLTEQAIAAAREIKFEPKSVNGEPVSSVVTIDYSFDIY